MVTKYIFIIPIRSKSTEEGIKAYLIDVYFTFGGSKYILSDWSSEFTSKQFTFLAKELGFIKVYMSPYTTTGNSIIEWTHFFLKAPIRKLICNHQIHWEKTVHIATMGFNVFPHSSVGESPFHLMFGHDPFMSTIFKLLLPKLRYMGDENIEYT